VARVRLECLQGIMRNNLSPIQFVALALATFLSSCTKKPASDAIAAGTPMADSIHFQFAVYLLPGRSFEPTSALRDLLAKKYNSLKLVDEIPQEPKEMLIRFHIQNNVQAEYAPPDARLLRLFGHGISKEQELSLQKSKKALILDFAHPKQSVWMGLRTASSLVEEVARETGGLVWDEETREMFSPDAWREKRLEHWTGDVPDISRQTVIHVYNSGEYARAITLGMAKTGLPDVVVQELPWPSQGQAGNLINLFCQSLAEGTPIALPGPLNLDLKAIKNTEVSSKQKKSFKANASGLACLSLKEGAWEEGDPKNRLIQLSADRYMGDDSHARQERMLSSFFGWEDSITKVHHNEEVLAESRKEREKLPELQRAFAAGLQPGEYIQVKAPFHTPEGNTEWMWVDVTGWKGDKIKGLLANEPFEIPNLHSGQMVEVRERDVFDYIRYFPDKHSEGNTTGEILRKMEEAPYDRPSFSQAQKQITECRPNENL
jgi:uncharacterized protein YegJ (DUF2314 family)